MAQKVYQIQINGLTESVKAVDALNESLKTLESRIKALDGKSVSVGSKSLGGGSKSSLSEEEKLEKQINQLEEKRVAYSKEIYQNYLAAKDVLKEVEKDQKSIAATERLQAKAYSNTIQGMKEELADIKSAMQTVDLGDSGQLEKMTQRANELNNALKKIEESYGQFGRNVGNYKSAADGFKGLVVEVGGVAKEFESAKKALKELKAEMQTLSAKKDLGLISEEEANRLKDLIPVVSQLQSAIQDAGKPMDALMDTMQSIVAIAQTAKGFSAFFGFDGEAIERSIQKLVALQNAMQGLQTIQKQLQSGELFGGMLSKASSAIDAFAAKIAKTDKAAKALSLTLKTLSGLALVGVIIAITKALSDLNKKQKDVEKAAEEGIKTYAKTEAELSVLQKKLNNFNGTKEQEKKLVDSLNSKYGNSLGQYKSLAGWKDALIKKGKVYCQVLQKEAEMQALMNLYTENYIKLQQAKKAQEEGNQDTVNLILGAIDGEVSIRRVLASMWDDFKAPLTDDLNTYNNEIQKEIDKLDQYGKEIMAQAEKLQDEISKLNAENEIMDYAPQIDKNGKKTKDELEKVHKAIEDLELRLMKDGLVKKLRQLDEEERQTLNELKKNGRVTAAEIEKVQRQYAELRKKEIEEYLKSIEEKIKASAENIKAIKFDLDISEVENKIQGLKNQMEELSDMSENSFESLKSARDLNYNTILVESEWVLTNSFNSRYELTKTFYGHLISDLIDFIKDESALNKERIKELENQQKEAESNRYSIQMSGLTEDLKLVKNGLKAIEDRYKVSGLEEIETIKGTNKEIYEQYHELFAKGVEIEGLIEMAKQQHKDKLKQITEASNNAIKKNELDTQKDISLTQEKYYDLQINNFRDLQSKINAEMQRQPVTDLIGFGIVNLSQSKKNYNEIKNAAIEALDKIEDEKDRLDKDLEDGVISDEVFEATAKNLYDMELSFKQTQEAVNTDLKDLTGKFIDSIGQYINAVGQTIQGIMSAVWEFEDYQFDKQQEELDKWNEELDKALDEQEDIISEHSKNVNSIEDELANSRGDRRQHLIDQLNAEIQAQREAEKERQRIEKEQEKAQKRQDALDKKRKEAEYDRNLASIKISGAMAITNAFATQPFIPVGLAMGALATTLTAVQYALAKQQKPYAKGGQLDGGVAVGNRHRDGGIKVLGGRAEIEGGEFITNRISTQMNAPLLEFINSKKKRIDISDMIDFYSSGSVKKNIANVRTKFEDGGYMPTLPNALDVRDQLQNIIINQDNRPIYVSVVDINNKQEEVRKVQTLAGL